MYGRILVGLEGSMAGRQVLGVALERAKVNDTPVTVVPLEGEAGTVARIDGQRGAQFCEASVAKVAMVKEIQPANR